MADTKLWFNDNSPHHSEEKFYLIEESPSSQSIAIEEKEGHLIISAALDALNRTHYANYSDIVTRLKRIESKHDKHDDLTTESASSILEEIKKLRTENTYFRKQLQSINTPTKLKLNSFYCATFASLSLGLSNFLNINILHPIASTLVLAASLVFFIMSLAMEKQDRTDRPSRSK